MVADLSWGFNGFTVLLGDDLLEMLFLSLQFRYGTFFKLILKQAVRIIYNLFLTTLSTRFPCENGTIERCLTILLP